MRFLPDPILRTQAKKISKIPSTLPKFTDDMVETMIHEHGVGLAANQVGSLQKVCVIQLPEWEEAIVLINPEITEAEGEVELEEVCLSLPGYRGITLRSEKVKIDFVIIAVNPHNQPKLIEEVINKINPKILLIETPIAI